MKNLYAIDLKKNFSRRGTLTFLSLEAVAKYLSSSLQAHDQIILACWFFLSLRATRLKSWPVASKKKWNKQIKDHSLLIVGGGGGLEDFGGGGIVWFSGRTEGGSVVTNRVLKGGRARENWLAVRKGNITILQSLRGGGEGASKSYRHTTRLPRR